jgi:hypothetical protein
MLGYDNCFAIGSSGHSGGLGIYQNNEINVEFLLYSQYHIDARITVLSKIQHLGHAETYQVFDRVALDVCRRFQ